MSETNDLMSPDASPGTKTKASGVRRVNNMPVYLFCAVVIAFFVVMAMVAADRAAQQNVEDDASREKGGNTTMFAKAITGDYADGMIEAAKPPELPMPAPEPASSAPIMIAKPQNLDMPPPPPPPPPRDEEAHRIRQAKLQLLQEAIKAKTGVQAAAPRSAGSARSATPEAPQTRDEMLSRIADARQYAAAHQETDPTAAYQARLSQIQTHLKNAGITPAGGGTNPNTAPPTLIPVGAPPANAGNPNNINRFADTGNDRWRLDSKPEPPRTDYELRAGFVVPATLISGINSDLPGQIVAQVAQNVYDTPTGNHLLIPLGSRLVGSYSSEVAYGQARVLVAWQRIVFPDGKAMDIGAMPGADGAGYAGFHDKVDNHYIRIFASAFLMSGITAGITYSQRRNQEDSYGNQSASGALSEAMGQQLGQATAQMISKNLNIAPTLQIRPGYRFNVIVVKDMTFSKPYQSFDY